MKNNSINSKWKEKKYARNYILYRSATRMRERERETNARCPHSAKSQRVTLANSSAQNEYKYDNNNNLYEN